jgi:hypothetical protein
MAGRTESHTGNTGKALELLFRAERLSPGEPRGWFITGGIAIAYFHEGRVDEAIAACRRGGVGHPGFVAFAAVAPTIPMTVPIFSAVMSRQFGGSTSGIISATLSL